MAALCFIETSSLYTGRPEDTHAHTPEAWVSTVLAQELPVCFPSIFSPICSGSAALIALLCCDEGTLLLYWNTRPVD